MFFLCLDTHTQDELLVDDKIHELFRYEVVRTIGRSGPVFPPLAITLRIIPDWVITALKNQISIFSIEKAHPIIR